MQLSQHFSLAELTVTNTGIKNEPNPELLGRLILLADRMEKVRSICGDNPVTISSGYRSPEVNKAVGGVSNSDHMSAYVCDFTIPRFGSPYDVCKAILADGLRFDQLIHERKRWVHISFAPRMRQQILTLPARGEKYKSGLLNE